MSDSLKKPLDLTLRPKSKSRNESLTLNLNSQGNISLNRLNSLKTQSRLINDNTQIVNLANHKIHNIMGYQDLNKLLISKLQHSNTTTRFITTRMVQKDENSQHQITKSIASGQYKLKINDTLAKSLLDSLLFRSKFGLKPDEKVNILVLRRPVENDQLHSQILSNNGNFYPLNNRDLNLNQQNFINSYLSRHSNKQSNGGLIVDDKQPFSLYKTPALIKLAQTQQHEVPVLSTTLAANNQNLFHQSEAKLTPKIYEQDQFIKAYQTPYDWSRILSNQYRQDSSFINFHCPRNGLFSHPHVCTQFLQCVYFGTIHQRYYVLNCPTGLYFNQHLELCDYPSNVNCKTIY